jgi:NSS family neurotransmitter:Na+ symporter
VKQFRQRWPTKSSFLLAAVGGAIGVNAFTHLPAQVAAHGGGAFFVPLLIAVASVGLPMMALEFGLGLCYQGSVVECMRKVDKRMEWIGWWSVALCALACVCSAGFMAWAGIYVYDSGMALLANQPVPWAGGTVAAQGYLNQYRQIDAADVLSLGIAHVKPIGSLLLTLMAVWALLFSAIRNGIPSLSNLIGKILPLALVMMAMLTFLVFKQHGESAVEGIAVYLQPDWSALLLPETWWAAYGTVFRTLMLGAGVYVAYASYLNRSDDATASAGIAVSAAILATFLLGLAASAAVACSAAVMSVPTTDLLSGDIDAVFAVLATAATGSRSVPGQASISLLLFLGIFLFSLLSTLALLTAVVTAICDKFQLGWEEVCAKACVVGLIAASIFVTNLGFDLRAVIEELSFPFSLILCASAQCLALGWISDGLRRHLNAYSVIPVGSAWWSMIAVVIPAFSVLYASMRLIGWLGPESGYSRGVVFTAGVLPCVVALAIALSLTFLPRRQS